MGSAGTNQKDTANQRTESALSKPESRQTAPAAQNIITQNPSMTVITEAKDDHGSIDKQNSEVIDVCTGGEFVLEFGPKTIHLLIEAVNCSYKLFWDGSISMFKDTSHSASNNKSFLLRLLEMRLATQEHQEPPVTLMHGPETEVCLRESLFRIKQDQQAEAEAAKKRALEADSDAQESENLGDDESKEETTLQEDMESITDFLINDPSGFTTKLLQGVPVRALFSFQDHRHKPEHEKEEALDILDAI